VSVIVGIAVDSRPSTPAVAQVQTSASPKNLVVVMGCTLRRDQLSPYGGPQALTPFMTQMAQDGVVFEDLVSSSSWTKESSTALFTGFQAASVGMIEPGVHHSQRVLSPQAETLAERLSNAGWFTAGVTANPHLNTTYGLAQGFTAYRDTASAGFAKRNKIPGTEVVQLGLDLLDGRPADAPFYLRLVLIDPHTPLNVPFPEIDAQRSPGVPERLANYRAGVARVDQALSDLDEGLRARGFSPENTYLVLVTDHGEGLSMPEHHRGQHGRVLYRSLTSVPWLIRGPGVVPHRIAGIASHLDVTPTLLGLLEQPIDADLPGRDWSTLTQSNASKTDRTHAFTSTWYFGARRSAVITENEACQHDFGSKAMRDSVYKDGCFDRRTDPDWTQPNTNPRLTSVLSEWHSVRFAEYEAWADTTDAPFAIGSTHAQLEALGYVE
ncbi:MAG: sulfatase-like hydrolase/transferase, partial [Rhodobacterales bacterium]|nr:sulfatase-like hydrolase/transferase [Rhodobacterales bacterium]